MKAKKSKQNPYQTNKGGLIHRPFTEKDQPTAGRNIAKGDLRTKK